MQETEKVGNKKTQEIKQVGKWKKYKMKSRK